ncbi:MAG: late competence development ComFB family protein, partial [Pseudanabaena sp.]
EAIARVAEIETNSNKVLDLGDIAAYALNRLPPLYATTEQGANYQRERAMADLKHLIAQQVKEALEHNLDLPEFFPDRSTFGSVNKDSLLSQLSNLLQAYAPNFEEKS